jgi:hypothetical protein
MNPFTQLVVKYSVGNHQAYLEWDLDVPYDGGKFVIRKSPDGERNVRVIAQGLPSGDRVYVDHEFYLGDRDSTWFYQIVLQHGGRAYYSGWVQALGRKVMGSPATADNPVQDEIHAQVDEALDQQPRGFGTPLNREFGIMRQIMKLEMADMRHSGSRCAILVPKDFGTRSNAGIDSQTDQETNVHGSGRYGEQYEGGFEDPIPWYMKVLNSKTKQAQPSQDGAGHNDIVTQKVRMVAAPRILKDYILVNLQDDVRYKVIRVDTARFKGEHGVVSMIDVAQLSFGDPAYKFKVVFPTGITLPWDPGTEPPDSPYYPGQPSGKTNGH